MNIFSTLITQPLGFILRTIYGFVGNYGWSIIIFTILIKLILFPLTYKSQKSMEKQKRIQPLLTELQAKYANDKEKLQKEMSKLYQENGINPLGGCLPMLLQFPILIGLYQVISRPLTYLLNIRLTDAGVVDKLNLLITKFAQTGGTFEKYGSMTAETLYNRAQIVVSKYGPTVGFDEFFVNFNFFGMDLSAFPSSVVTPIKQGLIPTLGTLALVLIPLLAAFTTWLSSKLMQPSKEDAQRANANSENTAADMSKSMTYMMPIMTGFITFTLPTGMGLYWIVSNVMQILQQRVIEFIMKRKGEDVDVEGYLAAEADRKKRKKRK